MRQIKYTKQFRHDYKREKKSGRYRRLNDDLLFIIDLLLTNQILPANKHDHVLTGDWSDHRDCHLKPDLILIYRKTDPNTLELVRLGSHSELSL